eukprot:COSAG01_NODE_147_length_24095_cov_25.855428_20_plen_163_part_00
MSRPPPSDRPTARSHAPGAPLYFAFSCTCLPGRVWGAVCWRRWLLGVVRCGAGSWHDHQQRWVRRCGHQQLHPRSLSIISALSPADPYSSCNQKISGLSAQCDRSLSSRPADQTAARAEQSSTSTSSTRPLGWVPPNNRTTVQLDLRRLSERCTHTHAELYK